MDTLSTFLLATLYNDALRKERRLAGENVAQTGLKKSVHSLLGDNCAGLFKKMLKDLLSFNKNTYSKDCFKAI